MAASIDALGVVNFDKINLAQDNDGSASSPSLTFGDADTGFYATAVGEVLLTVAGTLAATFNATGFTPVGVILGPDGAAAGPTFSFASDVDTGFFLPSAGVLRAVAGAATVFDVQPTVLAVNQSLQAKSGASLGAAGVDGGFAVHAVKVSITAAQTRALAATQIELVAAPGASRYLIFLGALLELDFGTVAHDDAAADGNLVIRYTDGTGQIASVIEADTFVDAVADAARFAMPTADVAGAANPAITPVANAALVLDNDGAEFTGSGDSTIDIVVYYANVVSQL